MTEGTAMFMEPVPSQAAGVADPQALPERPETGPGVSSDTAVLEAARHEAAVLETAVLEAAVLEATELETAELEAAVLETAVLDAAELEVAELEVAELEVAVLEAAVLETAATDVTAVEAAGPDLESVASSAPPGQWHALTPAEGPGIPLLDEAGPRTGSMWPPRLPSRKPKLIRGPGVTVHAQIEDWLADAIAAGRLAPGDRLPTEQHLAAWLGVSRMTLRHALGELAQRGLVTRTVGRSGGTFVAEPKLEQDLTVLAGFSEQLRRHGLVAGARVLAAAEIPASPAASAALGLAVGDPVYEVRRLRLAGNQPILIEHSLFPAERCKGLLDHRLDGSLYELLEEQFGLRPYRAKESLEPVTAGVREAEALGVPEGAPLMLVERTAYSKMGLPLEFARDLFRGDRTRVVVWTSELAGEL